MWACVCMRSMISQIRFHNKFIKNFIYFLDYSRVQLRARQLYLDRYEGITGEGSGQQRKRHWDVMSMLYSFPWRGGVGNKMGLQFWFLEENLRENYLCFRDV